MSRSFAKAFRDLTRAQGAARAPLARALVERKAPWSTWAPHLNDVHLRTPEDEGPVARLLVRAARAHGDDLAAARFRLIEARALHRTGSPPEAAAAFADAAAALHSAGDAGLATKAQVLRVDALAHAGDVEGALRLAGRIQRDLRGRGDGVWRAVLRINRANALRLAGRAEEAIADYDAAARALRRRGDLETAAVAGTNAGVALMDAGRPRQALARFERAHAAFEEAGQTDRSLDARQNAAWALIRCGEVGAAVGALTDIAAEQAARGLRRREAVCRMDLAEALLRAGDHAEAVRSARQAERAFKHAEAESERCEALLLAAAASWPSRPADGRRYLREARKAAERSARPGQRARCDLLEQDERMRAGRPVDGRRLAAIARRAAALGNAGLEAECLLLQAQAAWAAKRYARAKELFADARLARPGRPWLRCAAQAGLARCEARGGDPGAAIRRLRRVATFLDGVRAGLPGAWLRTHFALAKLDPYLTRIDLLLARGRPADRREAEAVLDALAARRFVEGTQPQMRGPLGSLRRRLEAIYDQIARGGSSRRGVGPTQRVHLEQQAQRLEREVSRAWRSSERGGPAAQAVETARPRSARLGRNTAAIHVWLRDARVRALVRRGAQVDPPVDLGSVAQLRDRLDRMEFNADRALHFGERVSPAAFLDDLDVLAQGLLAPLDPEGLPERVLLVQDPSCPDVPWELLPVGGRALSAQRCVARVPSLRVRRRRGQRGRGEAVVTLGESDLPGIAREIEAMGPKVRRLAGNDATRVELREALVDHRVVHLAGHGHDAPDAPGLAGVRVRDGWFTAVDIPPRIGAELVVLAACRTGAGAGPAATAWGGLAHGLLRAGARWVIWTADEVDDSTTADLMTRFHGARRTHDVEQAFGLAIAHVWEQHGHPAGLLDFRLSGIAS